MRQILLFLVAVASHFVLQAYEHTETLEFSNVQTTNITHNDTSYTKKIAVPGRTWWYRSRQRAPYVTYEWAMRIGDEITINGETWNKVDVCMTTEPYYDNEQPTIAPTNITVAYIKDDGINVSRKANTDSCFYPIKYHLYYGSHGETFSLYKFGELGEVGYYGDLDSYTHSYTIDKIETIQNSGYEYRKFTAIPGKEDTDWIYDEKYEYIEGIGHPSLFMLIPYGGDVTLTTGFYTPELIYVTEGEDNHVIFEALGGSKPWEYSGVDAITVDECDIAEQWYNLQGIAIEHPTSAGVYICRKGSKIEKVAIP